MSIQYIPQGVTLTSSSFATSGSYALTAKWNSGTASLAGHGLNAVGLPGDTYIQSSSQDLSNVGSQGLTLLVITTGSTGFRIATSSFETGSMPGYIGPIDGVDPTLNLVKGRTYQFLIRGQPPTLVESTFKITNNGASAYTFDIGAIGNNPSLTLVRGYRYEFRVNASGHPFWIQNSSGAYNPSNVLGESNGVYNNGQQSAVIQFIVPITAPNTLYYVCQFHSLMAGTINIVDDGQYRFRIQSSAGQGGTIYNTGVTNNNIASGSLTFKVPTGAPGTLYYGSPDSNAFGGTINISS